MVIFNKYVCTQLRSFNWICGTMFSYLNSGALYFKWSMNLNCPNKYLLNLLLWWFCLVTHMGLILFQVAHCLDTDTHLSESLAAPHNVLPPTNVCFKMFWDYHLPNVRRGVCPSMFLLETRVWVTPCLAILPAPPQGWLCWLSKVVGPSQSGGMRYQHHFSLLHSHHYIA